MNNNDDNAQHQKTSNQPIDVAIRIGLLVTLYSGTINYSIYSRLIFNRSF